MSADKQLAQQQAFATRMTSGKPGFEAWFSIFMHPESRRALWLRYTRLTPRGGTRPSNVIWASLFDANAPDKHVYVAEVMDDRFLQPTPDGAMHLALNHLAGGVETPRGRLSWDLELQGSAGLFNPLPNWLTSLPIGGAKDLVIDPRMRATGSVTLGDERMNFDGACGQMHHMWGTLLSQEIYYLYIPAFDDDPEGWSLETVAVKPDRMSPFLTWAVLSKADGVRSSGGLLQAMRSGHAASYPNFSMNIRGAGLDVSVDAKMPAGQITAYQFRDPDGKPRFVEQCDVCSASVEIHEGGRSRKLSCRLNTVMEFHRMTAWSDLVYLDPFGPLFPQQRAAV